MKFQEFQQPLIEGIYQNQMMLQRKLPQQILLGLISLYQIIKLIQAIMWQNSILIYWEVSYLFIFLMFNVVSLKGSSEKLKACFYSCCNLLILQQIYCDRYQSFQLIYLSGQINMAFSILMVKYTSFKASTVYVGVVILAKTLIQTYFEPFNPVYFISLILLSFSILMVSYINEKYRRLAFLHQFTNRQWESIIPTLIQNPFLLFTFDEERMIFRIKLFNDIQISDWGVKTDQSENLRYFLRTYYVGKETLEQYIVSKLKRTSVTQSELLEQKLKITKEDKYNDQQKQIAITFSQFELSETVFMIVFDQNEERVKGLEKIKNALIQGINQHQELTLNFIKKQLALINQSINLNPGIDFLYKLKLHCLYFQGRFTQCNSFQDIEEDVKFFSLKFLIKEVVHIYEMAFPSQKFEITFSETHEYQMFSNLKLVQIYILTIFQSLYRQQNQPVIYVHIKEINQEIKKIQILITCYDSYDIVKQLLTNQIFYKIQTRICPSTKIKVKNEGTYQSQKQQSCSFCIKIQSNLTKQDYYKKRLNDFGILIKNFQSQYMQQFQSTFSQYHPNKREEFQVGQELTMQKRKSRTSKDLIRRITIQADGFRQNNNKTIRYPSGFNLMTKVFFLSTKKADYDNIPGDKLLPWIERDFNDQQKNFVVRILFSRNNNELVQSNIAAYTQPTAIYFTDLEYGKSFIRYLRLKSQEKEENKLRFKRLFQLYQKRCVINVFQQANRKLEFASKLIQKEQQRKRDELKRCKDISNYDKNNFQKIFRQLLQVANKRQDEQKQNKIKFLLHKQHFYHSIQTAHKQFINKWLSIAQHKEKLELLRIEQEEFEMLEELKKQEQEEQERLLLEEEERRKQEENDKQLSKQLSEQQRKERDENSEKQGLQKQDLLLTNIKLILDPQIQLISPVMRLQFTKHSQHYTQLLESEGFKHIISNDKEYFDKFYILQKGDEGWELKQNFKLHQYKLQDVFTITIYEEGREYSERDHNRTAVDLFTKSNKKILTNNVTTLELKQNLEGVKRMYIGLNTSADFQQSYIIKNKCNYPMITLQVNSDIDMNLEAKILNQNIIHDPNNLAYIKLPIDIQDLCLLDIKNLYEDKLTEDWDKLRIRLFFQGLRNRGQNHANQLLSRDYITEAMEITQLYENGFNQDILLIDSRNHYDGLSNEKIDKQGQTQIRECLIQASLIGLDYWQRVAIIPKLLNFNTKIDLFAKQNQLAYKQNNQQLLVEFLKQYENLITNEESNHYQNLINKYFDNQKGNNDYFNNHINEWKPKACQVLNAISVLRDQHNYPEFLIPLLFKLFQFLNQPQQQHAYLDGVFMILIISEIDIKFPENSQKQLDRLGVSIDQLFFQHAKGLWADFFYYDAWLRVFDYYCGQLYNNQDPKKIIGSIVSGILQGVNIQNIQSKQELLQKLKIYGQLTCNLDLLIQDSHNSLLHDNFTSQGDSLMRKFIQELDPELRDLSAINHILRDQQKFDPNSNEDLGEEIIYEFEVPDEHENSIYRDTQEQFIEIQSNVSDRFVQKSKPISIQLYINQIYIHTTSYNQVQVELQYGQQVANKIFGESQLHFTFNYDGSNIIKVLIHNQVNKFEQAINIYKYRFNQVTKDCLLLKDNYETEKHYQLSSFEFSIKVIDNINSAPLTQILDDHIRQTIGSNNKYFGFTSPQEWKKTNQMNYSQFKQLVWKYFQCDASRFNLQELFTYLRNGDGVYLIDFIAQYVLNLEISFEDKCHKIFHSICLFQQQSGHSILYVDFRNLIYTLFFQKNQNVDALALFSDVKFIKVVISDESYTQEINLTQSFNKYLLENFKNLNSYDILLFDAEYKVPLQDILDQRTFEQVRQLNTQQYKLKLKVETFGQIRKLNYNLSRGFQLINQFEKLENEVSQFDVTNKILSLDCHGLINEQEFTRYLKKIWVYENYQSYSLEKPLEYYGFMRLKSGSKIRRQLQVISRIDGKAEVAKYLLINFQGLDKQHVLYKQDVFGIKSYEEIDAVDKFWKQ